MSLKNQILQGRNERNTKTISLSPDQIIMNLAQNVLLLLNQKFEILFLLKKLIKTWDGEMCKCRMFTYNKNH